MQPSSPKSKTGMDMSAMTAKRGVRPWGSPAQESSPGHERGTFHVPQSAFPASNMPPRWSVSQRPVDPIAGRNHDDRLTSRTPLASMVVVIRDQGHVEEAAIRLIPPRSPLIVSRFPSRALLWK